MFRLRSALVLVGVCAVLAVGCVPKSAPAPQPQAPQVDPSERGGTGVELQQPLHFDALGTDVQGREFQGYLVVEGAPDRYLQAGYFYWYAQPDGGRYHFKGTFDPQTRAVCWTGYTIEDRVGGACNAVYRATLSLDGRRFENGKWSGGISVPGTWSTVRIGE
jgi:hypothetical protein